MGFPKCIKIPVGQPNRTTKYNFFPKLTNSKYTEFFSKLLKESSSNLLVNNLKHLSTTLSHANNLGLVWFNLLKLFFISGGPKSMLWNYYPRVHCVNTKNYIY